MNQSELEANTSDRRRGRENACEQVMVSLLIGRESGARFLNQSQSVAKQNRELL